MKISVQPLFASTVPSSFAKLSIVRQLVVPTQTTRPPARFVSVIILAVSSGMMQNSECMSWSSISSSLTGRKVPSPTCSVTKHSRTPFAAIFSSSSLVKCSPAVGAAAEPSSREYTV